MIFEVSKVLPKNQITLPKDVRVALNVSIGDRVAFTETVDGFLIKKVSKSVVESIIKEKQ